ncbi:hypothetical protein [Streptomyces sp. NRRL S-646]|uniref:hypothetical protein n=1 Tax=Streptomyces sp. NRRL S-646 TaxID=1463917 RepID=UPI000ACAD025|nr:hypothetical protein [Streptomyces sp. NRRL S-646]
MTVPVRQIGGPSWETLVFEGIDDVGVEKVSAAFGTVGIAARGCKAQEKVRGHRLERVVRRRDEHLYRSPLSAAIMDRLTFGGNIIETGGRRWSRRRPSHLRFHAGARQGSGGGP